MNTIDTFETQELIVERLFNNLDTELEQQTPQPINAFFGKGAFVVLGDPGSGKTTCFEESAKIEDNAMYVTVRDFVTLTIDRFKDKILYLDALDEMRSHTEDGRTVFDRVRQP